MGTEKKYTPKDYMSAYLKMNGVLSLKRAAWKKEEAELKDKMAKIVHLLQTHMVESGDLDQLKLTGVGIAFYKTVSFLNITDWDAVIEHVKKNDLFHVLGKKLAKTAVIEIIEATKAPFPGAELGSKRELKINKR